MPLTKCETKKGSGETEGDRLRGAWVDDEIAEGQLPDKRLDRGLRQVFDQMGGATGQTIPRACHDWANTKAAYRFFSNSRASEHAILKRHFEAMRDRVATAEAWILGVRSRSLMVHHHS